MHDRNFFEKVLDIKAPWFVEDIALDLPGRVVRVAIGLLPGTKWFEDGSLLPIAGYEDRTWRHLDTMQLNTVLCARVPRVKHPGGATKMVAVPWAGPRSRWTLDFEAFAVCVIQAASSLQKAAEWLALDWESVDRLMHRAVERGLARRVVQPAANPGIDEKSFRKGHRYGTLVNDLDRGVVLEVVEDRTIKAASTALAGLGEEFCRGVDAVAIDMSQAYLRAVNDMCPNAFAVYDKFHVSKLLGEAVDRVRRAEHAELMARRDGVLKKSRYDWLTDPARMSDAPYERCKGLVALSLKTSRAWHIRTLFDGFWKKRTVDEALDFFNNWHRRACRSRRQPVKEAAATLKRHLPGLLACALHSITNAMSEGL